MGDGFTEEGQFPFVDPPDPKMVRDGFRLLTELGAVDGNAKLTPLGRAMAKLPVDPKKSIPILFIITSFIIERFPFT